MAAPIPNTVVIDQGRDFFLTVYYKDAAGVAINLTGYTAAFALSQNYNGTTLLSLTTGAGITITPATGRIDIQATYTQTAISAGTYVAELAIYSSAPVKTSLLKGQIVVAPKVI